MLLGDFLPINAHNSATRLVQKEQQVSICNDVFRGILSSCSGIYDSYRHVVVVVVVVTAAAAALAVSIRRILTHHVLVQFIFSQMYGMNFINQFPR